MRAMVVSALAWVLLAHAGPANAGEDLDSVLTSLGQNLGAAVGKSAEWASVTTLAAPAFAESGPGAAGRGAAASSAIAARLAGPKLNVLDAQKLAAMTAERRLQLLKGDSKETTLARAAGAQAVLVGAITDGGGGLTVQARIVLVSTGKVLASDQKTAKPAGKSAPVAGAVESESIEVAIRKLSDGLAAGFQKLPGNARYRRLAVLPFTEVGEQAAKRRIGAIVTAEVATDLRRDHDLLLVERARLVEVMNEIKLGESGAVDPATAPQIGKLADAQALIIGSASDLGDRYLVDARIVGTETGETLAANSVSLSAAGMVALASDAVVLRSRKDAVFRSLLIPGWGQIYNRQSLKGGVILATEVGLIGTALAFHFAGNSAYSQYTSQTSANQLGGNPTGAAQSLYDTASSRYRTRNILLFTAAGLWVANILDAYLSGVDGDALLAGGVASSEPKVQLGVGDRSFAARMRW